MNDNCDFVLKNSPQQILARHETQQYAFLFSIVISATLRK